MEDLAEFTGAPNGKIGNWYDDPGLLKQTKTSESLGRLAIVFIDSSNKDSVEMQRKYKVLTQRSPEILIGASTSKISHSVVQLFLFCMCTTHTLWWIHKRIPVSPLHLFIYKIFVSFNASNMSLLIPIYQFRDIFLSSIYHM